MDPAALEVRDRLSGVKNKILVLSGKGGVGKSTVSAQLAFALSKNQDVALLDIDICGPSVPQMMGVNEHDIHRSASGWSPVYWLYFDMMLLCFLLMSSCNAAIEF